MTILLTEIDRFNEISFKLSMALFTHLEKKKKKHTQFVWKHKRSGIGKVPGSSPSGSREFEGGTASAIRKQ